jgi:HEPN domain-containing protein
MASDEAPKRWRDIGRVGSRSAKLLYESGDYRGSANRAYYAVYHAATAVCVEHGDEFPHGRNNPPHDQLPQLILNNGDLPLGRRRQIVRLLLLLRTEREIADYRPGRTIDILNARDGLIAMTTVLKVLGTDNNE